MRIERMHYPSPALNKTVERILSEENQTLSTDAVTFERDRDQRREQQKQSEQERHSPHKEETQENSPESSPRSLDIRA